MLEGIYDLTQSASLLGLTTPIKCTGALYEKMINPGGHKAWQPEAVQVYYAEHDILASLVRCVYTNKGLPSKGEYTVEFGNTEGATVRTEVVGFEVRGEAPSFTIILCLKEELAGA